MFVDESKRRDFVLVAGVLTGGSIASARQSIQHLCLPGQHGLHMVKERRGRQRTILRAIADLDVEVTIYVMPKGSYPTERVARQRCLEELVDDVVMHDHSFLCIDRDESTEAEDRRVVRRQLERVDRVNRLRYVHAKSSSEPLLAIPDAIAWAWPQREWRAWCEPLITAVRRV